MLKFDEKKLVDRINGALKLRPQVEEVVDRLWDSGLRNICFMGIGGTYASALQTQNHVQEYSGMEIIAQNAALYNTTGNRRIGKDKVFISATSKTTSSSPNMPGACRQSSEIRIPALPSHQIIVISPHGLTSRAEIPLFAQSMDFKPAGEAQRLRHPLSPERAAEVLHAGGPPDAAGRRLPPVRAAVRRV